MSAPPAPKPADRSSLYIAVGVVVVFLLIGLGAYLHEQSTHGPFSADDYLARELTEAQAAAPDAALTFVTATYVTEDGGVQAAFDEGNHWVNAGYLTAWFHATPPATSTAEAAPVPLGAPVLNAPAPDAPTSRCPMLRLSAGLHGAFKQTTFGIERAWRDRDTCETPIPLPIHCKMTDVWQRALAAGAPHGAYADLSLAATTSGRAMWHFKIVDHAHGDKIAFEATYADDCP